ncbi:MAG: CAP domain-containing protein [Desulfitobacteriaceae bacterium]|nr:CAP domain-containing protein [Desulfitobacteriaceae bacterium]MDI6914750.1 CAP domain-containing protein [Desulfitobacteriaceae bacterium]
MLKKVMILLLSLILLDPSFNSLWQRLEDFVGMPQPGQQLVQLPTQSEVKKASEPQLALKWSMPTLPGGKASATEIAEVERKVVELINQDRAAAGLSAVVWDETAAKAARTHVQEEADIGYISHWGLDGMKPQERYTLVGGRDAVDENESVSLWLEGGFKGISKDNLYTLVAEHQKAMVNEKPPDDGHRKNILDPHHTGVGIAIAIGKNGIAMAQEFTNHDALLNPPPTKAAPGGKVRLSGQIQKGYRVTGIYAIWEEAPKPLSREELLKTHSYSDPPFSNLHFWAKPRASGYYIPTSSGNVFAKNLTVDAQGKFTLEIPLASRVGLDYINLEIAPDANAEDRFYAGQFVVRLE